MASEKKTSGEAPLTKEEKERVTEHANEAIKDDRVARNLGHTATDREEPIGLGIFGVLAKKVDAGVMSMPEARRAMVQWFKEQPDKATVIADGRQRMRRFKQIADALYEEFTTLCSTPVE